LLVERVRDISL